MLRRVNLGAVLRWLALSWQSTADLRMAAYELEDEPRLVRRNQALATAIGNGRRRFASDTPDMHTQLEDLLGEVWRQESFERAHPFTCGVIREGSTSTSNRRRG